MSAKWSSTPASWLGVAGQLVGGEGEAGEHRDVGGVVSGDPVGHGFSC